MTDSKYIYYENVSGSFRQLHVKSKSVPVFACPEAGERCPVHILDTYISKLPEDAKKKDLYILCTSTRKEATQPKRTMVYPSSSGKNTLQDKVKKICALAGVSGRKTNHSYHSPCDCTIVLYLFYCMLFTVLVFMYYYNLFKQ